MATTRTAGHGTSVEASRLEEAREKGVPWRQWGPYLSERQWGTVREDYSENGDAWNYFSHDQARSRAYHWGEDGISDDKQRLCFALALWNLSRRAAAVAAHPRLEGQAWVSEGRAAVSATEVQP